MRDMRFLSLVGNSASGKRLVYAARDGDVQEAKVILCGGGGGEMVVVVMMKMMMDEEDEF
ncbi:hypothetical protein A2U01_0085909 [Trifolium medium]|uniref:Uncharacterized protein n=1 Tax=Trifolium medium TaxID=97028 RepID=A0A392TTX9_9FABA|nr:hypothetical protein [Trifolium medium]